MRRTSRTKQEVLLLPEDAPISPGEAARHFRILRQRINYAISAGLIKATTVGPYHVVTKAEIKNYIANPPTLGRPPKKKGA